MTQPAPLTAAELQEIANGIWSSLVNLPLEKGTLEPSGEVLVSCVQVICSQAIYVVAITASGALASMIAGSMLQVPPSEISTQDRDDAFGEIANMLGGGVKTKIPGSSSLSMPVVINGIGVSVSYPKCVICLNSHFISAGIPLTISIYHQA